MDTIPTTVEVKHSKQLINKCLRNGGSCYASVNGVDRLLSHNPVLDRPAQRLIWPLSLFAEHNVHYTERQGETVLKEEQYTKHKINDAISVFLRELPPDETIVIMPK